MLKTHQLNLSTQFSNHSIILFFLFQPFVCNFHSIENWMRFQALPTGQCDFRNFNVNFNQWQTIRRWTRQYNECIYPTNECSSLFAIECISHERMVFYSNDIAAVRKLRSDIYTFFFTNFWFMDTQSTLIWVEKSIDHHYTDLKSFIIDLSSFNFMS